jgi:hypothetical protein
MHGIFYDDVHDEIVVPVALGGAVLTLPGSGRLMAPPASRSAPPEPPAPPGLSPTAGPAFTAAV